jgi:hypothetical protein
MTPAISLHRCTSARRQRGVALVIVLAFLVLLSGLVVAFFSRAISERQVADSSANQMRSELFADGAVATIVGDLKQEIAAGSRVPATPSPAPNTDLFYPKTSRTAVPAAVGRPTSATALPNLVKRSANKQPFFSGDDYDTTNYPASNRAANVSTTTLSQNFRSWSTARWNKALLLPKQDPTSDTDFTPVTGDNGYTAPDWILVARDGSNPTTWNTALAKAAGNSFVVGRYAYNIYDEGGLLDMNVAGFPTGVTAAQAGGKSALAFADLTQLKDKDGASLFTQAQIDAFIAWRNYATTQAPADFPTPAFTAASGLNYFKAITANSKGFLTTGNTALYNDQSDRMLASRQHLMKLLLSGIASQDPADRKERANLQNALQYLGTFSRDLNQPSYLPAVQTDPTAPVVLPANLGGNSAAPPNSSTSGGDKFINPSFPTVRVPTSFTRNDNSTANVGDPLVNKRFALQRLAWITYKGPSATRAQGDPDIQVLINNGIPWSYLEFGTADAIQKYFGLTWDGANNRWQYNIHNGGNTGSGIIMLVGRPDGTAANATKYVQDAKREPDFFELLKAGITVGSLGKAAVSSPSAVNNSQAANSIPTGYFGPQVPANLRYAFDSSVDYHVIQIGANILSEVNPTSYPIRITFDDGSARGLWEFQGVTDLPYLNYVFNGVLREKLPNPAHPVGGNQGVDGSPHQAPTAQLVTLTDPGNAYMVQVPAVWNPYDPNGTPGVLRPAKFRVVIDSSDPLSPSGTGDLQICRFAAGSKSTVAGSASNDGTGPPNAKYSIENDVTVGKSPDKLNGGPGTPIHDAVTFDDSNGALYREPTLIFDTTAPGNATRVGALSGASPAGNIKSIDANPLPGSSIPAKTGLAPLVLGPMPLAFSSGTSPNVTTYYTSTGYIALAAGSGDNRVYFTYRLQYQDPANSSNWITYDTKYGRTTHGLFGFQNNWNQPNPGFSPGVVKGPDWYNAYSWASAIDPRTARFGLIMDLFNGGKSRSSIGGAPADGGWIFDSNGTTTTVGITYPIRQDNSIGFGFANLDVANTPPGGRFSQPSASQTLLGMGSYSSRDIPYPSFSAGWTVPVVLDFNGGRRLDTYMFAPGMYAQNNPSAPFYISPAGANETDIQPCYYADADGVVRRAAGAYVPSSSGNSATTPVGLPTASINGYSGSPSVYPASKTPFTQSQSRPLLLHRPFRTVAELGYVFRDLPWKNLDFFTPESGDAALLDLFCINETSDPNGLVAGKVNLNTRQAPVLAAIAAGACVDDPKVSNTTVGTVSPTLSTAIGNALTARTADTTTANLGPLQNVSELVGKWSSAVAPSGSASGITYSPTNPANSWGVDLALPNYKDGKLSYTGFSSDASATSGTDLSSVFTPAGVGSLTESLAYIKRFREAPIRALASVGQTRVWNLMIDVVAQTGRYPQSATALDQFLVEGEQRYWVHVAIDRLTGQVVDKQIEVVKE